MNYRIVVSVDFGTAYSGYAYSHASKKNDIHCRYFWAEPSVPTEPYPKTPTCIAYEGTAPKLFGHYAKNYATSGKSDLKVASRFKLLLEGISDDHVCNLPEGLSAKKAITDLLRYLWHEFKKDVLTKYGDTLNIDSDVGVVMTVPVIWGEESKQLMKEAAKDADMPVKNLKLLVESEAAAIYVQKTTNYKCDDVFIIVDAGGGTVDVQMHEIKRHGYSEALDELSVPLGAFCGATFVDEAFVKLLQRTFTKTTIDAIKSKQPVVIQKLLVEFEKVKRKFTGLETEPCYLDLPEPLYEAHEEGYEVLEEAEGPKYKINDEMQIVLEVEMLKAMFDPQVENIIKMVSEHNEHPQIESKPTVVLVGGFSTSQYLQRRIREAFPGNFVVTPAKSGEAVLQGAVYYGWNPKALMSRRARFSFGIETMRRCGKNFDYIRRKHVWSHSKRANYYAVFAPVVTKGEKLPIGMTVPLLLHPLEYFQTSTAVPLSSCDDYITDCTAIDEITAAISNLCSATVSMPHTSKRGNRNILVEFTVGNVEMGVHAKDLCSGNEAEVSVDFSKANKDQTQTMYLPSNPTGH